MPNIGTEYVIYEIRDVSDITVEMAERSKALDLGSSPKGRGFKSHSRQFYKKSEVLHVIHVPGIEPGSSAWKALILTIGLHVCRVSMFRWNLCLIILFGIMQITVRQHIVQVRSLHATPRFHNPRHSSAAN